MLLLADWPRQRAAAFADDSVVLTGSEIRTLVEDFGHDRSAHRPASGATVVAPGLRHTARLHRPSEKRRVALASPSGFRLVGAHPGGHQTRDIIVASRITARWWGRSRMGLGAVRTQSTWARRVSLVGRSPRSAWVDEMRRVARAVRPRRSATEADATAHLSDRSDYKRTWTALATTDNDAAMCGRRHR